MLSRIQNISFNGIYDLILPNGTPQKTIDSKVEETKQIIAEKLNTNDIMNTGFEVISYDDKIRIVSSVDNPWMMVSLFNQIGGEKLAKDFVKNNIQEYKLDIQA